MTQPNKPARSDKPERPGKPALVVRLLRALLRGVRLSVRSLRRPEPRVIQSGNIVFGDLHAGNLDTPTYQRRHKNRRKRENKP